MGYSADAHQRAVTCKRDRISKLIASVGAHHIGAHLRAIIALEMKHLHEAISVCHCFRCAKGDVCPVMGDCYASTVVTIVAFVF